MRRGRGEDVMGQPAVGIDGDVQAKAVKMLFFGGTVTIKQAGFAV